jgi:hypothetical protein
MRATPSTMVGGSSSSAPALLLLVAALLVGACASGARADSNVDLVNTCANDSIVLLYNGTVSGVVIPAGEAVGVDLSFLRGLVAPLYIRRSGALFVLTPAGLSQILGLTGVLYKIEIACNGECGVGVLTIKPYAQVYAAGVKVGPPITITVCAHLVVA